HLSSSFLPPRTLRYQAYTLSLHDALPILGVVVDADVAAQFGPDVVPLHACRLAGLAADAGGHVDEFRDLGGVARLWRLGGGRRADRKSTRLNSSHVKNSYAVFCLKKKNKR